MSNYKREESDTPCPRCNSYNTICIIDEYENIWLECDHCDSTIYMGNTFDEE